MKPQEFDFQITKLTATFGEMFFKGQRNQLIWKAVQNLSGSEFEKITDHMVSNFRAAPLPKDFAEAAQKEMQNRRKSGFSLQEIIESVQVCPMCADTGHMYISLIDHPESKLLVRCGCECGDFQTSKIPKWENKMIQIFQTYYFPIHLFKPKDRSSLLSGNSINQHGDWNRIYKQFQARIEVSELFWQNRGAV